MGGRESGNNVEEAAWKREERRLIKVRKKGVGKEGDKDKWMAD